MSIGHVIVIVVGILIGDLSTCEPEDGRFKATFFDGDHGRTAVFRSSFPHVPEVAPPGYTR